MREPDIYWAIANMRAGVLFLLYLGYICPPVYCLGGGVQIHPHNQSLLYQSKHYQSYVTSERMVEERQINGK